PISFLRSLGLVESKENTMTFYETVEELGQKLHELFVEPILTTVLQFLRDKNQRGGGRSS
uniref:hypothetical protein n=1 Tax=Streptococcus suis TaxID=1307 RepID=UPI001EE6C9BA